MTLISRCSMTIEETLQIALDAHRGQKDLDGRPALLHPIAVGLMGSNDTEIMTGFLHDVVEDTAMMERLARINDKHRKALRLLSCRCGTQSV